MLAHIERQSWNWDRTIEAVKVVGALIAAVWALVQYGNQVETGEPMQYCAPSKSFMIKPPMTSVKN